MNRIGRPNRRDLLTGVGLTVGFSFLRGARAWAEAPSGFAPNAFIRIAPRGPIRLVMPMVEMGQGAYTTEATLIAEELDVGLDQIVLEHAPPNAALYANVELGLQATGGSSTTIACWRTLREAGAVARSMLIGAAVERWKVDPASLTARRGEVLHPASGRSATYGELASLAALQPVPTKDALKDAENFELIGKPLHRLDTAGKLDGSTVYGIDVQVPGMRIALVKHCPVFSGRVRAVDDAAARAVPGVREIVRLDTAVAVIADRFWSARKGLEALKIDWDLGEHADFSTAALFQELDRASETGASIVARREGDLSHGGRRIEAVYQLPMLAHAPMEPQNAVVHVRPGACEIWVGTQAPTRCVDVASELTGLPKDRVILHNQFIGGGFGRRLEVDVVRQAIQIAKAVAYPVKLIWTREQDIQHGFPRPAYLDRIAAVVDDQGIPVVWTDRVTGDSVSRRYMPEWLEKSGLDSDVVAGAVAPPYDLPNIQVEWVPHPMPSTLPVGWWRGVGPTHNLFTVESFVDELALAAGKDPVAYRRALMRNHPRALKCLELAAGKIGWSDPLPRPNMGRGIAVASSFGSHVSTAVELEVSAGEIVIVRSVTAVDCGMVVNPDIVEAQIQGGLVFGWSAALWEELTFKDGAAQQSNFDSYRIMRLREAPSMEVHIVQSTQDPGGIGEVGTAIAAPALANAVFAATGVRVRRLPIGNPLVAQHH